MKRRALPWRVRVTLWICTLSGGVVAGMGLMLWFTIRLIRHLRDQVDEISGVEAFLGKMTFLMRDTGQKLALAFDDVPEDMVVHSEHVSIGMMIGGIGGIAIVLRWILGLSLGRK